MDNEGVDKPGFSNTILSPSEHLRGVLEVELEAASLLFLESAFLLEFEEDFNDEALPDGEQEADESLLVVRETEEDDSRDVVELVEQHEFPNPDFLDTKSFPVTVNAF
ncbi:unnamed protein product [Camellia sinensis]